MTLAAAALAAALASAGAGAEAAQASSRSDRTEVRLGEPFRWTLEIRHGAGDRIEPPPALEAGPFRLSRASCERTAGAAGAVTTCTVGAALFDLGPHDLPDLRLALHGPAGDGTVDVAGPRVTGAGMIDPRAEPAALRLRPAAPPVPLLVRSLRLVWAALGAVAGLAAAAAAPRTARALRRRRGGEGAPPPPAGEVFARRLDALVARRLPARGLAREHFFELSAALRELVGAVAGVNALELTTAELVARLERIGDPRIDVAALRRFAEAADLVKYAREPATEAECEAAVAWARSFAARATASTSKSTSKSKSKGDG